MDKKEQLNGFIKASNEFIESKYILADVKIANLLKSIAQADTLLALFKNSLVGFDYEKAKKKYLVKSTYLSTEKGEFILPENSRELLALVFNVLVEIDSKDIELASFLDKYFYEDGSCSAGYVAFISAMVKPFCNCVRVIMESIIEGKIQDPIDALNQAEEQLALKRAEEERQAQKDKELSKKTYGTSIIEIKKILSSDKTKIKNSKLKDDEKESIILVIDMFANVLESTDKDAIIYASTAYNYMARCHKIYLFRRVNKIGKLLKGIIDEL